MAYKDEWRVCKGALRVQNTDYIASDYVATLKRAISGDYNKWGNGETVFTNISIIDKYLRVPTKLPTNQLSYILDCIGANTYQTEILNRSTGSTRPFFRAGGQVAPQSKALDYMPRAYIVLRSVQEVMDTYQSGDNPLIWAWISKGFSIGTSAPRGWFYDKLDFATFYELMADYYVIDSIIFYTNKTDGTEQEIIGKISRESDTTNVTVSYDNIIPLNVASGDYVGEGYFGYYSHLVPNYLYSPSVIGTYKIRGGMTYGGLITNAFITGAGDYVNRLASGYFYTGGGFTFSQTPNNPLLDLHCATKDNWSKIFNAGGCAWSYDLDKVIAPDDSGLHKPTTPGQPSNPVDDKEGTGDNISDKIEYPAVSYIPSAYTKYWITPDTVIDLKKFLFSQTFFDNIQRLWENPGEYIVDCTYYPLNPAALGLMSADEEEIPIGNILSGVRGHLYPDTATAYHFAGKFLLEPYYNSYLDYAPYTSVSIYIPYIGIRPLDVSRITGHTLILAYSFDFNTRQITAHLGLDGDMNNAGGSLGNALDSFTGAFGVSFPFSGTQNNAIALNVLQHSVGAISSFGAMVGGVATGNIAAVAGGAIAAVNNFQKGNLSPETYGNLTPIAGLYNPQQPYLIINRPITAEPEGFKSKQGYASCYSGTVGEFSGFLQCAAVDVPSAETMTVDEQTEIENLLLGGIYCG